MYEKVSSQASSNEDLAQLSARAKPMEVVSLGDLDTEHGAILKDWSAQDFANIYVRFRPHLISHARKFLREETQAEEVVQDAFLYLMTALPELDSELGVLRFLKWKTKMLCIDILRSSSNLLAESNESDIENLSGNQPDVSTLIERAEDSALVQLALARLSQRQREALLATVYEGKSYEQLAGQMGLESNAARQLVHRARKSFRKALIGEADAEGKSISQILSLAARRHRRSITVSSGLTAIVFVLIALVPVEVNSTIEHISATKTLQNPSQPSGGNALRQEASSPESRPMGGTGEPDLYIRPSETDPLSELPPGETGSGDDYGPDSLLIIAKDQIEVPDFVKSLETSDSSRLGLLVDELFMDGEFSLAQSSVSASGVQGTEVAELSLASGNSLMTLAVSTGGQNSLVFIQVSVNLDGYQLVAVPRETIVVVSEVDDGFIFTVAATDFVVGDLGGDFSNVVTDETLLAAAGFVVEFSVSGDGRVSLIDLIEV